MREAGPPGCVAASVEFAQGSAPLTRHHWRITASCSRFLSGSDSALGQFLLPVAQADSKPEARVSSFPNNV